jgi:hypothetical protein
VRSRLRSEIIGSVLGSSISTQHFRLGYHEVDDSGLAFVLSEEIALAGAGAVVWCEGLSCYVLSLEVAQAARRLCDGGKRTKAMLAWVLAPKDALADEMSGLCDDAGKCGMLHVNGTSVALTAQGMAFRAKL